MWKRFRRRSMAPRRPAVFPEQVGLVIFTAMVLLLGAGFLVWLATMLVD